MQKNLNIEKIIYKVVQIKFLAMHINKKKIRFYIFTVGNLLNIFMEHDLNILMIFDHFDPYNVFFGYCYKYNHAIYDWFCAQLRLIILV